MARSFVVIVVQGTLFSFASFLSFLASPLMFVFVGNLVLWMGGCSYGECCILVTIERVLDFQQYLECAFAAIPGIFFRNSDILQVGYQYKSVLAEVLNGLTRMRSICQCESHGCQARGGVQLDARMAQNHRRKDQLQMFENAKAASERAVQEELD